MAHDGATAPFSEQSVLAERVDANIPGLVTGVGVLAPDSLELPSCSEW